MSEGSMGGFPGFTQVIAAAENTGNTGGMEGLLGFLPIILLFVVFYFLLIRPQQKYQKERQEMVNNLKKGDKVQFVGGMHGVIKEIHDDVLVVRVADNVNVKFSRQGVEKVMDK